MQNLNRVRSQVEWRQAEIMRSQERIREKQRKLFEAEVNGVQADLLERFERSVRAENSHLMMYKEKLEKEEGELAECLKYQDAHQQLIQLPQLFIAV